MSSVFTLAELFEPHAYDVRSRNLKLTLANSPEDIRDAQRLRYQVFVKEMGARVDNPEAGIERDRYDKYCQHLIVRDLGSGAVVGYYRLLTHLQSLRAGGFYTQTEFDISRLLALPGSILEVGRTCVHPDYRRGSVIALLWRGIARFMVQNRFDYLMGCASIPVRHGAGEVRLLYQNLARSHLAPPEWRVYPKTPLAHVEFSGNIAKSQVPPLIQAYLRMGAKICGDPAWDSRFNVADLCLLLRAYDMRGRYARHFVHPNATAAA